MLKTLLGSTPAELLARAALASPFLASGVVKLTDFAGAVAEVEGLTGLAGTVAVILAALVIVTQIGGAVLLMAGGRLGWLGAGALAGFTLVATLLAHAYWTMEGAERTRNMMVFWEHAAICGGLLLAGRLSLVRADG
jgi:uncharacterized membrane protein YphA (DoxX/SURF4 family)